MGEKQLTFHARRCRSIFNTNLEMDKLPLARSCGGGPRATAGEKCIPLLCRSCGNFLWLGTPVSLDEWSTPRKL